MRKKIIISVVVSVLLLFLAYIYFYDPFEFFKKEITEVVTIPSEKIPGTFDAEGFTTDISLLVSSGKSYYCEMIFPDEADSKSSAQIYLASNPRRIRTTMNTEFSDGTSEIIDFMSDGQYNYMWSSGSLQGFISEIDLQEKLEGVDSDISEDDLSAFIADAEGYEYKCKVWEIEDSVFIAPESIDFLDYQILIELDNIVSLPEAERCGACRNLPEGDIRQACLEEFACGM